MVALVQANFLLQRILSKCVTTHMSRFPEYNLIDRHERSAVESTANVWQALLQCVRRITLGLMETPVVGLYISRW